MAGFFAQLKQESEPNWTDSVQHNFVKELCAGTISDAVMARYLVQDHRFIDNFLVLLGAAVSCADRFESRITLGRFIGMISSDENDYFLRCFKALGVSDAVRRERPDSEATRGLKRVMLDAAASGSYAAILAVLSVAEGLYLDWGQKAPKPYPPNFVHHEWITLHDNEYFSGFVAFLHAELNRVGPASQELCREYFLRTVRLEKEFFDEAYIPE